MRDVYKPNVDYRYARRVNSRRTNPETGKKSFNQTGAADRLNRPRFYAHFLCWEGWRDAGQDDEDTKVRAVRLVREHRDDYGSEWAAMKAIAGRLGMNTETLRRWVRQAEIDAGEAAGVSSQESRELRELRKKNRELEQTIEILKAATTFFARECDPLHR